MNRKLFCEVVQGVVYEDRCLLKLSKMTENSKACAQCTLSEILQLRNKIEELKLAWKKKVHKLSSRKD